MALTPLDFPASPTVGQLYPDPPITGQPTYQWDGAQWLSKFALGKEYVPLDGSVAMTGLLTLSGPPVNPLHATTKKYVDETSGYAKKNYIINGAMQVSQENGILAGSTTGYYPVDQFNMNYSNAATQYAIQVNVYTPSGASHRVRITVAGADTSVAAGDYLHIRTAIEGVRTADLKMGSASPKTVTLQFGVKAPAGTYCVGFVNYDATRSYVAQYTVTPGEANTDVVKSVTVPLDTAGTWSQANLTGIDIRWVLMSGITYQGAPNAWTAGFIMATANQFNFAGSTSNVFELFDVSLTEGTVAPPFQVPDYASELALCQRYWRRAPAGVGTGLSATSVRLVFNHAGMRAAPSVNLMSLMQITDMTTANPVQSGANVTIAVNTPEHGQYSFDLFTGLVASRIYYTYPNSSSCILSARL